ncbi:MAG: hypothetical protein V8T51_02640 [Senegalimassilia faecalis]
MPVSTILSRTPASASALHSSRTSPALRLVARPRNVHDAVRASVVAAVLHLHTHARAKAVANGQCVISRLQRPNQLVKHFIDLQFSRNMHAARCHGRERIGIDGRCAAGYHHVRRLVRAQGMAHRLARFLLGFARDGARVHHDDVRGGFVGFLATACKQARCERIGFHAVDLAAKIHDGEVHARSFAPSPPSS